MAAYRTKAWEDLTIADDYYLVDSFPTVLTGFIPFLRRIFALQRAQRSVNRK